MKIITEPHVHISGVMDFRPHPEYELPSYTDEDLVSQDAVNLHSLIAMAGKGCYDSYGKDGRTIKDHIRSLVDSRHGSVLEHAVVALFLTGISRGLSHELVRHRHFSFSQRSTRYTAEEGAAIVLDPYYSDIYNFLGQDNVHESTMLDQFMTSCRMDLHNYKLAVELLLKTEQCKSINGVTNRRKWARGKARQLLPHALETRLMMTGNLRSWRHFLEERSSRHAEPEIRRLAEAIWRKLQPLAPYVFEDYTDPLVEGFVELTTGFRKV